jgi:hypothetical protein
MNREYLSFDMGNLGTAYNGTKLGELWLKIHFSLPAKTLRFPIKRGSCCDSKAVNHA